MANKRLKSLINSTQLRLFSSLMISLLLVVIFSSREFLNLSLVLKICLVTLFAFSAIINVSYIHERKEKFKQYEEKRNNIVQYLYILVSFSLGVYAFLRVWIVNEFYQVVISLFVGIIFLFLTVLLLWGLKYSNNNRK